MQALKALLRALPALCLASAALADPAPFVAGEAVEWRAAAAASPGRPPAGARIRISALEVIDPATQQPVVMLRRGQYYVFWLWFDVPICAPYMNRIVALQLATPAFERVWMNEQSYCDIYGTGLGVTIAPDAPLGRYRWNGETLTFNGSDTARRAAFEVIEVVP